MLKVSFDIGGVLSKYPDKFRVLIHALIVSPDIEIHVMTDMHEREYTLKLLEDNGFGMIPPERVHNSDYAKHGEMCKAILMRDLGIDLLIDDFPGYCVWDWSFGPAPIRCLVQPDPNRPYWSKDWKTRPEDGEFGRRVYTEKNCDRKDKDNE